MFLGGQMRTFGLLFRPQQRFLVSPQLESGGLGQQLRDQYGWIGLEEQQDASENSDDTSLSTSRIYMPGSGIAKRLYLQWYFLVCPHFCPGVFSPFLLPFFQAYHFMVTIADDAEVTRTLTSLYWILREIKSPLCAVVH